MHMQIQSLRTQSNESSLPKADTVEKTLSDQGARPEEIQEILWLLDHAQSRDLTSFAAVANETGFSSSTISRVLRGKYGADLPSFCAQIAHFRSVWTESETFGQKVFVPELSVVRRIHAFCKMIRRNGEIGIIWGKNQSGKSRALEYVGRTEKMAAYVKLPAGGATKPCMKAIAEARGGIALRKSHEEMRDILLQRFNHLWLLLVDEFHQTIKGRTFKTVTIDRIREFYDDCETPLVLCGTDIVPDMMEDPRYKDFLGQIGNRGIFRLQIPTKPEANDILLLAKAYGFKSEPDRESSKIIAEIAKDKGIGKLSKYFRSARALAKKRHTALTWSHFLTTNDSANSWAKGDFNEA